MIQQDLMESFREKVPWLWNPGDVHLLESDPLRADDGDGGENGNE